jgi:DNA-binding LytR/AlgR family response regulator
LPTRLKCLLLDDELPGLSYLKLLCEQISELEVVKAFNDPAIFLEELGSLEFDLCILDIEMPGASGLEIAKCIKGKPVIFTTAYKVYAADAFELDAIDYVLKPIAPERLQQAVNKAIQRNSPDIKRSRQLRLNTEKGVAFIEVNQLVYIRSSEIDSRDKAAFMKNGTSLLLKNISFEKLASQLPNESFCRINKKEMISLSTVQYFSNDQITTNIHTNSNKPLVLNLGESFCHNFILKLNRL